MAPPPGLMLCEFFDSGGLASDADGLAQSDTAAEIPAESGDDAERGRGQEDEKQVLPQKCFHDPPPDDDCPLGPKRRSTSVRIRLASGARICPRFTRTPSTSPIIREIRIFYVRLLETVRPRDAERRPNPRPRSLFVHGLAQTLCVLGPFRSACTFSSRLGQRIK